MEITSTRNDLEIGNEEYSLIIDQMQKSSYIEKDNDLTRRIVDESTTNPDDLPEVIDLSKYLKIEELPEIKDVVASELKIKYCSSRLNQDILNFLKSQDLMQKLCKSGPTVGPFSLIEKMVEQSYNFESKHKYDMAEQICYLKQLSSNWRSIGGDGNCFYRSVTFGWLENLVITGNSKHILHIINRIDQLFTSENPNINKLSSSLRILYLDFNKKLVISILMLIFDCLKANVISSAYDLLMRAFNFSNAFDISMILYLRFEIYEFLAQNQDKMYSPEFPVLLGNLLPNQYESDDCKFNFEAFFEKELLKLYTYAEKIVVYTTPFIIKQNIKLLMFDYGKDCNIQTKYFSSGIPDSNVLLLLYRKCHYDLSYMNDYASIHRPFLSSCVIVERLKVVNEKLIDFYKQNEVDTVDLLQSKIFDKKQKLLAKLNSNGSVEIAKETKTEKEAVIKPIKSEKLVDQGITVNIEPAPIEPTPIKSDIDKLQDEINRLKSQLASKNEPVKTEIVYPKCIGCSFSTKSKPICNLPCGCLICSESCNLKVTDYLSACINNNSRFVQCGECSKDIAISSLIEYCNKFNSLASKKLKTRIYEHCSYNFNSRCMFCDSKNQGFKVMCGVRIKDSVLNQFFEGPVSHIRCKDCAEIPIDLLECQICERIHK